ncbi:hypothetical protein [Absidia glauca]|uniref:Secreted protein n=1 Tax=Absidia glauca TaxID=4829 RepID=A0A168KU63_ABSGL|nr:hypothetical protein [Absidia glauca]
MKVVYFHLLIAAMAFTVSAQEMDYWFPDIVLVNKANKRTAKTYNQCFSVENVVNVHYVYPAICQNYSDKTCKTPTSEPAAVHAKKSDSVPKDPKAFVMCKKQT